MQKQSFHISQEDWGKAQNPFQAEKNAAQAHFFDLIDGLDFMQSHTQNGLILSITHQRKSMSKIIPIEELKYSAIPKIILICNSLKKMRAELGID